MSRGQPTGRFAVGLLTAVGVAGGGWWFLRTPGESLGDLDRTESLRAAEYAEEITIEDPQGAIRLPAEPPFTLANASIEYRIEANGAQAAVYGLPAERVRTWGMLATDGDTPVTREALAEAMRAGGAVLDTNQIPGEKSEFVTITGTWNGMLLLVSSHRGETITVTLVDR